MKTICGIDEAGRGPVIGPMIMCGVLVRESDIPKLQDIGVRDSKFVTPKRREVMVPKIKEIVIEAHVEIITPEVIDAALNSSHLNLNWLEANTTAAILDHLKPDKAIIDCPSNNVELYEEYLKDKMHTSPIILLEHKAERHLPVAAASLIAKSVREAEVAKLKLRHGDFGSGYMADSKTVEFLEKYFEEKKDIFRMTWAPYQALVKKKNQKSLGDF